MKIARNRSHLPRQQTHPGASLAELAGKFGAQDTRSPDYDNSLGR